MNSTYNEEERVDELVMGVNELIRAYHENKRLKARIAELEAEVQLHPTPEGYATQLVELARLSRFAEAYTTFDTCPKCGDYCMEGYICAHCGFAGGSDD